MFRSLAEQILLLVVLLPGAVRADDKPRTSQPSQTATESAINGPTALAIDHKGHLYVLEYEAGRVLQIDIGTGLLSVVLGDTEVSECPHENGIVTNKTCLMYPESLALDSSDNLYIGELAGYVRKIDVGTSRITTVAGDGKN